MTEINSSISKGLFVFKNGFEYKAIAGGKSKSRNKTIETSSSHYWKQALHYSWSIIEKSIASVQEELFSNVFQDLTAFVAKNHRSNVNSKLVPVAVLLTDINQPDHCGHFENLTSYMENNRLSKTAILSARNCKNLKYAIESMVFALMYDSNKEKQLRRSYCTLQTLEAWFSEHYGQDNHAPLLTVIISDFELFNIDIFRDLVVLMSSRRYKLPFVVIIGVATSLSTLHNRLPYEASTRMEIKVFSAPSSRMSLNYIVEKSILSSSSPLKLSGNLLKFIVDKFLLYDFSISGLIQSIKFCASEQFFDNNIRALCCPWNDLTKVIASFSSSDLESIRKLPSFRAYIEQTKNYQEVINLLENDDCLKNGLCAFIIQIELFFIKFQFGVAVMNALLMDLPKSSMGKQLSEIYITASKSNLLELPEFEECWKLITFLSQDEIEMAVYRVYKQTKEFVVATSNTMGSGSALLAQTYFLQIIEDLNIHFNNVVKASSDVQLESSDLTLSKDAEMSRQELREKLRDMALSERQRNTPIKKAVADFLKYVKENIIGEVLIPFTNGPPLIELFLLQNIESVRNSMFVSPRGAIQTALNNPHQYLNCKCCKMEEDNELRLSMPDLTIAYKLHLECGRMINLYDWLQAFKSVADDQTKDSDEISSQIQARFTGAVTELQFIGYIKSSKRKTDHATRLTW